MKLFLLLLLLSGCGSDPLALQPCAWMTDDDLAHSAARVWAHVVTELNADDALNWCRFSHEGNTWQEYDCCVWLVEEFFGEMP